MVLWVFAGLWKFREVGYVLLIAGLLFLVFRDNGGDFSGVKSGGSSITVVDGSLREEVVDRSQTAEKPKGLGERLGTRTVEPDTVYVSHPLGEIAGNGDSIPKRSPSILPSESVLFPEWGLQEVDIDGHRLSVSSLSRRTGEVQRSIHTLSGDYQPGVTIRAGNVPRFVREDRSFDLINFRARGTAYVGVNAATGSPRVIGIISGPIEIGTERIRLAPAVMGGVDQGVSVGATLDVDLF